jgi:hypothetical protein
MAVIEPDPGAVSDLTPAEQRERAIRLMQQMMGRHGGGELAQQVLVKFGRATFTDIPDEECAALLAECEKVLAVGSRLPRFSLTLPIPVYTRRVRSRPHWRRLSR